MGCMCGLIIKYTFLFPSKKKHQSLFKSISKQGYFIFIKKIEDSH